MDNFVGVNHSSAGVFSSGLYAPKGITTLYSSAYAGIKNKINNGERKKMSMTIFILVL